MSLPEVDGWIIDFRTVRAIFESGSNQRIDHCVQGCKTGKLFACHEDRDDIKSHPALKAVFFDDQMCICVPDADVLARACTIASSDVAAKRMKGNEAAVFIAATAASKNLGVISDHTSFIFSTVSDICISIGVPVMTADQYFAAL
jgi:hypothetical protein